MAQVSLALADADTLFLKKLSAYLHKSIPHLSLELFTEPQAFKKWVNKMGDADLVVISAQFYRQLGSIESNNSILLLRDCAGSFLPEKVKSINKYIPAESILKEILSVCAEKIPGYLYHEKGSGKITTVFYADGSDAFNPFAQALAYYKASEGDKIIYLNLDEFSNTDLFFSGNNDRGLSELLYYIKSKKDNLYLKTEACFSTDITTGISFMKGHNNPDDIKKLSQEEISTLVNIFKNQYSSWQTIISKAFTYDLITSFLLKEASKVYITGLNYPTSIERLKRISAVIIGYEEDEKIALKDKVVFCISPAANGQRHANNCIEGFSTLTLPYWDFESSGLFPPSQYYISQLKEAIGNC
jgi:hypothetical protein